MCYCALLINKKYLKMKKKKIFNSLKIFFKTLQNVVMSLLSDTAHFVSQIVTSYDLNVGLPVKVHFPSS